ncbi:MAG: hypothetical protein J6A01_04625 [Proteobacteria bacterium]|nr:hypothetical protein [Pseudomonadota bacterium]
MKKIIGISVLVALACAFWGCAENGLECNPNTFEDRCQKINGQLTGYLEICTYEERARFKCNKECIEQDGPDVCDQD